MSYSDYCTHCILHVEDVTKETKNGKDFENHQAKTKVIEFVMDYVKDISKRMGHDPELCLRPCKDDPNDRCNIFVWFWDVTGGTYPDGMMEIIAEKFPTTKVVLRAYRQAWFCYCVTAWNGKVKIEEDDNTYPLEPEEMKNLPVEAAD